jgi:hypothetical protein
LRIDSFTKTGGMLLRWTSFLDDGTDQYINSYCGEPIPSTPMTNYSLSFLQPRLCQFHYCRCISNRSNVCHLSSIISTARVGHGYSQWKDQRVPICHADGSNSFDRPRSGESILIRHVLQGADFFLSDSFRQEQRSCRQPDLLDGSAYRIPNVKYSIHLLLMASLFLNLRRV